MQQNKTKIMVEGAVMVALAAVLSYIRIYRMPWGGSVSLVCMLPICLYSIKRGLKAGLTASFALSLIQFAQGIMDGLFGWGLTGGMLIGCILFDYILPYTAVGLAGIFRKKKFPGWICGIVVAITVRFIMHFLSGCIIWASVGDLWPGFSTDNTYIYSLAYNGAYLLPELILTVAAATILLKAPVTKKLIAAE